MKIKNIYLRSISVLAIAIILLFSGCNKKEKEGTNIVDVLSADSNFSIFVAALQQAEISIILEDYGPLTVFAPTNAAFDELFNNLGVAGIEDLSAEVLAPILYYHMLNTEVSSNYLYNGYMSTLSAGPDLQAISLLVNATESTLNVDANIINVDIKASNGVIHIIDKVLLPPTVLDLAKKIGYFTHFVEAVLKADLDLTLSGAVPYTIFAPIDLAFEDLFTDRGISGIADMTKEELETILNYHIANGNTIYSDLSTGFKSTLNGNIYVEVNSSSVVLNNIANVIVHDLQGKNGVIHVIDKVLTPARK